MSEAPPIPAKNARRNGVKAPEQPPAQLHQDVETQSFYDVFNAVLLLRIVNALTLATFFQPDEYFQALEPAWKLAFGEGSGAWITWEWRHQLRSSLHPMLYAGIYKVVGLLSAYTGPPALQAALLIGAPKLFNAVVATSMDYYTWRLGRRIFGWNAGESYAVIAMLVFSPWQWFVSTRSLSNGLETALTAAALFYWPWDVFRDAEDRKARAADTARFKYSVVLAAIAIILRPTNALIWLILLPFTLASANQSEFLSFVKDSSIYGSAVLIGSQMLDRYFYGFWTFPALNFLKYNLTQNLAVFYGVNREDYYFTEGVLLLLTTVAPFAHPAIYLFMQDEPETRKAGPGVIGGSENVKTLNMIFYVSLAVILALTTIAHKEARFIYPLLPLLTIDAAPRVARFFDPFPWPASILKRLLLLIIVACNVALAFYASYIHQRGPIALTSHLRNRYEHLTAESTGVHIRTGIDIPFLSSYYQPSETELARAARPPILSVAFLMPCHSTPWRSHLVYPGIDAWALTCEPPVDKTAEERAVYLDEADVFYADPAKWLHENLSRGGPPSPRERQQLAHAGLADRDAEHGARAWPMLIAGFAQLQTDFGLHQLFHDKGYTECWRTFNSHWHDDWRRQGDIVLWCAPGVDELTA